MTEDRRGHPLYVVGKDKIVSPDRGQRLRGAAEGNRGPRTAAERKIVMLPRVADQFDNVITNFGIDEDLSHGLLAGDDVCGRNDRFELFDRVLVPQQLEHLSFFFFARVT